MSKFRLFHNSSLLRRPLLLSVLLLLPLPALGAGQKELDTARAAGDVAALVAIAKNGATAEAVRVGAVESLPFEESRKMLDSDLFQKNVTVRYILLNRIGLAGQLPLEKHSEWVRVCILFRDGWDAFKAQSGYINALLAAKKPQQALSEARRLLGMTPVNSGDLTFSVGLIARCIKAESFARDKDVGKALAAFNGYLQAIEKKDVSDQPFTLLPYPTFSAEAAPEMEALEKSENRGTSFRALLYSGKYRAARTKAEEMFEVANTPEEVQAATLGMASAMIGEAGLPDAGNAVLGQAAATSEAADAKKPKPKAKSPAATEVPAESVPAATQ